MAAEFVQLREFNDAELMFDDQETRSILDFFFRFDGSLIASADISRELRVFAQGLLVAAVDATYAMGWIELTFRWVTNPGSGMKKALQKLAHRASRHWFKHLKNQSLFDAKIYERVRDQLALSFRSPLHVMLQANRGQKSAQQWAAFVHFRPSARAEKIWG